LKAVILAGGLGSRISEESHQKPKPMIEIGGKPILWHIMKIYSAYDINEFIICCGYKGHLIKEYFAKYLQNTSNDISNSKNKKNEISENNSEPWIVKLVDTGLDTQTGGRLKRVQKHLKNETFCFTYGDGLADVKITELIAYHQKMKTLSTVTGVQPKSRYGELKILDGKVIRFREKPLNVPYWVNGGFFILEPGVFDYIDGDSISWEYGPMEKLTKNGQLSAYKHKGFWQSMDTLRDKSLLEDLWNTGKAPWKVW